MNFPTLYQKTNTGAIQYWKISVEESYKHTLVPPAGTHETPHGQIITEYGQVGTDKPQKTSDLITEGKNEGKKNATTALQQALLEARAKHEKQLKKGYVDSIEKAQRGEVDDIIEGGIEPMLAQPFDKKKDKVKYPCYYQPKLDGIRCVAVLVDGKCTLWSRTRKRITSMPHIEEAVEAVFEGDWILDGELYSHELKHDFEKIVSAVRTEEPTENSILVQYHIYDHAGRGSFQSRLSDLMAELNEQHTHLRLVHNGMARSETELVEAAKAYLKAGYEGAMARNVDGAYENKRSNNLQKVKFFLDDEFEVIDVTEGRGKMTGHGIFVCKTEEGQVFEAKMEGELDKLKEVWHNKEAYKGKKLTVKYQGLTTKNRVPRFPVGLRIREEGF
jgi:DNA ligase 1